MHSHFDNMTIVSCLSIFFCFLVILTSLFQKFRRTYYLQIIIYIQFCNLFTSFGTILGYTKSSSSECYFQGIVTNIFPISNAFWVIYLIYFIFKLIVHKNTPNINHTVHIVCWIFPLLLTVLPFINSNYSTPRPNIDWCFIVPREKYINMTLFWYWFSFYFWIWAAIFSSVIMYAYLYFNMSKLVNDNTSKLYKNIWRLLKYPLITALTWSLSCLTDTFYVLGVDFPYVNVLTLIGDSLACSQGALTGIYFLIDNKKSIMKELKKTKEYYNNDNRRVQPDRVRVRHNHRALEANLNLNDHRMLQINY